MECRINFESTAVWVPYTIDYHETINDIAVIVLNSFFVNKKDDRDFDLESNTRNVLGFDSDSSIRWVIPEPPRADTDAEDQYYERI